ncbi:hypothetical protein DFJ74DRAFT_675693 [Hyaloraphidium curvatum]|nr:hypothetical protein DFJ74DRAFT_675693 [Hyaloraphidium curvatum]
MADLDFIRARLLSVESRIHGDALPTPASSEAAGSAGLGTRVATLQRLLARELQARPDVQQFVAKLESLRDILSNETAALVSPDVLPVQAQLELITDGLEEYAKIAEQLKQIDEARSVLDKPLLEPILPHAPRLAALEKNQATQAEEVAEVARQLRGIMADYNAFVQTTSEIFIGLHQTLSSIERAVARANRGQS